jgi:hypothetical protein
MNFPEFNSSLLIVSKWPFAPAFLHELIGKFFQETSLTIEIRKHNTEDTFGIEWIPPVSLITLYVSNSFLENHFEKGTGVLELFYDKFKGMIKLLADRERDQEGKDRKPLPTFSVLFQTKEKFILQFLFDNSMNVDYHLHTLQEVFAWILKYEASASNSDLRSSIEKTFSQTNKIKYMTYVDSHWVILDPLLGFAKEININYKVKADKRIKKPLVILHENDFRKYFVMDTNWVLQFDGLETMMLVPNDVSLYASICEKRLNEAHEFYKKNIMPRFKHYHGTFPTIEQQTEYFDYFELVISSLIFSYTALEAFANICIPDEFEYHYMKKGKNEVDSKERIERYYSLTKKFVKILPLIIKCTEPWKQKWWTNFIRLEELRNEIIHTKPSRSEDRYSKLLQREIFEIIGVFREIIEFFGFYIAKNKKELLSEYPYNLKYDEFWPHLTSEEGYNDMYRNFYNVEDRRKT